MSSNTTATQQLIKLRAQYDPTAELRQMLESPLMEGYTPPPSHIKSVMLRSIHAANYLMRKSGNTTLHPLLPLMLSLKGKPYTLHNHFPFAPFFRTRMPKKTLLKTARQVGKSASLAAQGVIFSNCVPYFSTLYITPLFEMIRRFSQNYVAPFIETSPVASLFSGRHTMNNVLQRSFKNRSQMIFSFAYLDAERTRGISADKLALDESVVYGTPIKTLKGVIKIEDIMPGDLIYGIDENGRIREDVVVANSDHGIRDCYRITLDNGNSIEVTSDSFLATTVGWRRVSTIIEEFGYLIRGISQLRDREVPGITTVRLRDTRELHEEKLQKILEKVDNEGHKGKISYYCLTFQQDSVDATSFNYPSSFLSDAETNKNKSDLNHNQTKDAELCGSSKICEILWVGKRPVRDLQTENHRSFFAGDIAVHNCQDMDISLMGVIQEVLSASLDWGLEQYAGTPKSLDNTIEYLWQESSMAEWMIKCHHPGCHHWNIPAMEYDLIKMIGPLHDNISEETPGIVCGKCAKPLQPRPTSQGGYGRWVHRKPELRWDFASYHIPQIIMPMHYAIPDKWATLLTKQQAKGQGGIATFYNEVCGESFESGSKLVTVQQLIKAASLPWECNIEQAKKHIDDYVYRFCSVDWGGGGVSRGRSDFKLQSYTSIAILGLKPNGQVDVIYGYRSLTPHDHVREAKLILDLMATFNCSHLVHDYTGAGTVRETVMHQAGLQLDNILPVAYTGPARGGLIQYKPATQNHPRGHYTMDRNRALSYCCQYIKSNIIHFFKYDYKGVANPGLIRDFLALIEDKTDSGAGRGSYRILRDPSGPDDFAQAVTMGTMLLYQLQGSWPDLTAYEEVPVDPALYTSTRPITEVLDWEG